MKNFDEARAARTAEDRTFQIGGEEFTMKASVRPEALADYERLGTDTEAEAALAVIDAMVVSFIEGGKLAEARYRKVRAREEDAISMEDLSSLVEWLIEEQTRRPTSASSASSDGRKPTADSLTDGAALAAVT